jgi:hypothetical protein
VKMLTHFGGLCCVGFMNTIGVVAGVRGGVPNETVKYGREFCRTSTQE